MNINLHLTDDTQLRAHGFVAASVLRRRFVVEV